MKSNMPPVHPGEFLREDYMDPLGLSANALAIAIGISANRITELVSGKRGITAETAILLARALDTTPDYWMNLQYAYELRLAERSIPQARLESICRLVISLDHDAPETSENSVKRKARNKSKANRKKGHV
jgi:addiction module HigA family antidote